MASSGFSSIVQGIVGGGAVLVFFGLFSTVVVSLALPPDQIPNMPRWFRTLSVIRRTRAARLYYGVVGSAFVVLALIVPVVTIVRWTHVDPSFHVAAIVSWAGIVLWLVVLWLTTAKARQQ